MAKIEKLEDLNKGNKLSAHLALAAAEQEPPAEGCLDSEELADIAAGLCSPEQREKAIAHFSSCRTCYDNWVAISFSLAAMERGATSPKRSFLSLRNLGYLGSAFAVAASVVVFLNVRQGLLESQYSPVPAEEYIATPAAEMTDTAAESVESREAVSESVRVMPTAADAEKQQDYQAELPAGKLEKRAREPSSRKFTAKAKSSAMGDAEVSQGADSAMSAQSAAAPGEAVPSPGEWLESVYEACSNPSSDPAFWAGFHDSGRKVLALTGAGTELPAGQKERIAEVAVLLAGVESMEQVAVQCERILRLLAQETDKE